MNKTITIIFGILILIFSVAAFFVASSLQKGKYEAELAKVSQDTAVVEEEIRSIKLAKDNNGYLPTDVVKYFVDELKNNSVDKAKLYVKADKKDKDLKSWLGVTTLEFNMTDIVYNLSESSSTVASTLTESENEKSIEFTLVKEEGVWKIEEIRGE